jgi:hypothetical protein
MSGTGVSATGVGSSTLIVLEFERVPRGRGGAGGPPCGGGGNGTV